MEKSATLARPGLAVDKRHDDRHQLASGSLARESIPYIINLPEQGIAGFTYTWVNTAGEAGAMLMLFGPALDAPVTEVLADRPIPRDMGFDNWTLGGFTLRQDLQFGSASISWHSDDVQLDLAFTAIHPPYAYGAHVDGCPPYAADDRIEQGGFVKGKITVRGKTIDYDGLGHRDHSWGARDWGVFQHYNWFVGQTRDGTSVHFWRIIAKGEILKRGYVFKDGLLAELVDLELDIVFNDKLWQQSFRANILDEAGRSTVITGQFYAHNTLPASPLLHLREGAAHATFDGKEGAGWLEVAWPPGYLEHNTAAV